MKPIKIFGREIIDDKCVVQLENCLSENDIGVLTADAHYGYAHPIGGAIAYKDKISLSGVGFDIACGNKAVQTNIRLSDLGNELTGITDEIFKRISFGTGRINNAPIDHQVFDKIQHADFVPQRGLLQLAKNQLGTVGSGNHFIDIFTDEQGQ